MNRSTRSGGRGRGNSGQAGRQNYQQPEHERSKLSQEDRARSARLEEGNSQTPELQCSSSQQASGNLSILASLNWVRKTYLYIFKLISFGSRSTLARSQSKMFQIQISKLHELRRTEEVHRQLS